MSGVSAVRAWRVAVAATVAGAGVAVVAGLASASASASPSRAVPPSASPSAPAPASMPGSAPAPAAPAPQPPAPTPALTQARLDAAIATLRTDPLLPGQHTVRELRLRPASAPADKPPEASSDWFRGMRYLLALLAGTSRLFVFGLLFVAVAILTVMLWRFVGWRRDERAIRPAGPVSHVRDLDVRPGSLPDDVGGHAWALWRGGEAAAAMSLLYRGVLSRLIHRHAVPIESASTEGECLALARARVATPVHAYASAVVQAWQATTYGGRAPDARAALALCRGFAAGVGDAAVAASSLPGDDHAPTQPGDAA